MQVSVFPTSVSLMADEQATRWPTRRAAWLDGWKEGSQWARMHAPDPLDHEALQLRAALAWVQGMCSDEEPQNEISAFITRTLTNGKEG